VKRLAVIAALILAGCAAPSTGVPAVGNTEQADLERMVDIIWGDTLPPTTWTMGEPVDPQTGEPVGGYAQGYCVVTWCAYFVTIRSGYVTPYVVAHEGGHIVCASRWQDWSEECADAVAAEVLP
jgi:hypothetical protein